MAKNLMLLVILNLQMVFYTHHSFVTLVFMTREKPHLYYISLAPGSWTFILTVFILLEVSFGVKQNQPP